MPHLYLNLSIHYYFNQLNCLKTFLSDTYCLNFLTNTSQMYSTIGLLKGKRVDDKFYRVSEDVLVVLSG